MRAWHWSAGVAAALVGVIVAARAGAELSPVPDDIAKRLPRYCRYDLDLSRTKQPHGEIADRVKASDVVCPFNAGASAHAQVFASRPAEGCAPGRFADLPGEAVRELSGREYRAQSQCPREPSQANGRSYLLTDEGPDAATFVSPLEQILRSNYGAPFADRFLTEAFGKGMKRGTAYLCLEMLPGATTDPISFFRSEGFNLPARIRQEEIVGQSCRDVANAWVEAKHPYSFSISGVSAPIQDNTFKLMLISQDDMARQGETARKVRAVIARDGGRAARPHGRQVFAFSTRLVTRTPDGGHLALTGDPYAIDVDVRALTPGVCRLVFDLAKENRFYIQTGQPDYMTLRVKGSGLKADLALSPSVETESGADLCALLKPGFEEWRSTAPDAAEDLRDLDRFEARYLGFGKIDAKDVPPLPPECVRKGSDRPLAHDCGRMFGTD
jgi:hypothetical protein